MSTKHRRQHRRQRRPRKQHEGLKRDRRWMAVPIILVIGLSALGLIAMALHLGGRINNAPATSSDKYVPVDSLNPPPPAKPVSAVSNGEDSARIEIPLNQLRSNGRVNLFRFDAENEQDIRFLVKVRLDGKVVSTLDACEGCFRHNRGLTQTDGQIACRQCGKVFPVDRLGNIQDRCHPIVVPNTIRGDSVVIRARDLAARPLAE